VNAETVNSADDPFERAVRREGMLRRTGRIQRDAMRLAKLWFAVLFAAWAAILAGHWLVFPEPRWLLVLHTVVFALICTMALVAGVAQTHLARRLNGDLFPD